MNSVLGYKTTKDRSEYFKAYKAENRDKLNRYNRDWMRKYRDGHPTRGRLAVINELRKFYSKQELDILLKWRTSELQTLLTFQKKLKHDKTSTSK